MKIRSINKSIPYTVRWVEDGINRKKRFNDVESAWSYMRKVNGSICFGFRVGE